MPNPDLVTESSSFKAGNDNRDASNAFSQELWGAMGNGRGSGGGRNDGLIAAGAKLVSGVASDSVSKNNSDTSIDGNKKEMQVQSFSKEQLENGNRIHHAPGGRKEDMCIDLNINIELNTSRSHSGFNPGQTIGGYPRPTGHERVPKHGKLEPSYPATHDERDKSH